MNIYDIKSPDDIKHCSIPELEDLCVQIREFLIDSVSKPEDICLAILELWN